MFGVLLEYTGNLRKLVFPEDNVGADVVTVRWQTRVVSPL